MHIHALLKTKTLSIQMSYEIDDACVIVGTKYAAKILVHYNSNRQNMLVLRWLRKCTQEDRFYIPAQMKNGKTGNQI